MMRKFLCELKRSLLLTLILVLLLCAVYPGAVWLISQLLFSDKANGSFIIKDNEIIGSKLISQKFSGPDYFHSRPSSAGNGYDALSSGGSNLGPISKGLIARVKNNIAVYRYENRILSDIKIPADAVTSSASGLDPHISIENALMQADRVAKSRGLDKQTIINLIQLQADRRQLGILGEPKVNVLLLNIKLDKRK